MNNLISPFADRVKFKAIYEDEKIGSFYKPSSIKLNQHELAISDISSKIEKLETAIRKERNPVIYSLLTDNLQPMKDRLQQLLDTDRAKDYIGQRRTNKGIVIEAASGCENEFKEGDIFLYEMDFETPFEENGEKVYFIEEQYIEAILA